MRLLFAFLVPPLVIAWSGRLVAAIIASFLYPPSSACWLLSAVWYFWDTAQLHRDGLQAIGVPLLPLWILTWFFASKWAFFILREDKEERRHREVVRNSR
jgi:hypothetical protein